MAKNKQNMSKTTQAGVRRRRTRAPDMTSSGDSSIIKYAVLGTDVATDASGAAADSRSYVGGYNYGLTSSVATGIVGAYSTALFLTGTKIRWEPTVSFTTSGRVYVGFTDNPEVIATFDGAALAAQINIIQALGSMISFPVWQETDVVFPTKTRKKRFDTNNTMALDINAYDRCIQTNMLYCVTGAPASTTCGSFWYHDVVSVEGIHSTAT